ncbi:diadenosine tetraphosphate (Ap4A) HIT family hydrolase [Trueperella bonasi]|uniref:Diadenosine tetraphosphate (Ap4A) HIT family hydrolase n=1 Tax=Trueperella bonasi TaxID=312286 RepID=A0ABT9NE25_9ACTO|nr:HIT family protein [Trueperella bonasi]MDP9805636.1 diadenosine tetraphosphate (Ap4A) HIT family hydrolase [Trueperella bonasi]
MASVFSKIIAGELPGQIVWKDEHCVVMATIEPMRPGHVMVIPLEEVDKFNDVDPAVFAHMAKVAQIIAHAQERAFNVPRAVTAILGFEVPHTHIHVIPAESEAAAYVQNAHKAEADEIASAMDKLRKALGELGHGEKIPPN